jgi:alpha-1,2-mannosyltransferase
MSSLGPTPPGGPAAVEDPLRPAAGAEARLRTLAAAVTDHHLRRRLLLGSAGLLAASVGAWLWTLHAWAYAVGRLIDLHVYYSAGHAPWSHLYRGEFGPQHLPYIYPPAVASLFGAVPGFGVARTLLLGGSVAALVAVCWWSLGMTELRRERRLPLTLALSAVALWLEPVQSTLMFGQVNLLLLGLVVFDAALPNRSRWKGLATGIAAGVKITPALFAVYYAATGRRRVAAVAFAGFAGTALLGLLLMPEASVQYWLHVLPTSSSLLDHRIGLAMVDNQSLTAMVLRLLEGTPFAHRLGTVLSILAAAFGVAVGVAAHRRGQRLAALLAVGAASTLASPIAWSHHWVWTVPGLVLVVACAPRAARALVARARITRPSVLRLAPLATGLALTGAYMLPYAAWPLRSRRFFQARPWQAGLTWRLPHNHHAEYAWHGTQLLIGNLYPVSAVLLLLSFAGVSFVRGTDGGWARSSPRP